MVRESEKSRSIKTNLGVKRVRASALLTSAQPGFRRRRILKIAVDRAERLRE